MMRPAPILLCLTALAGCATAMNEPTQELAAPAPPPPPPAASGTVVTGSRLPTDCPLTIAFASYGAGIDNPARERIQTLLVGDRGVSGFDAHRWGREGEVTFCVRTRGAADSARLFHRVRALVPPQPRGPIALRTLGGLNYETRAPRR